MLNNPSELSAAKAIIEAGGIIAMPTESVYGLHCSPRNETAIKKILSLKQRDASKGFILIAGTFAQLHDYIEPLPADIENKLLASWPGPFTWIVPARHTVSQLITGQFNTLAVRVSSAPHIARLCHALNSPLISTSANITGHAVARNAEEIKTIFPQGVDLIIEGYVPAGNKPSSIRDAFTDELLR